MSRAELILCMKKVGINPPSNTPPIAQSQQSPQRAGGFGQKSKVKKSTKQNKTTQYQLEANRHTKSSRVSN